MDIELIAKWNGKEYTVIVSPNDTIQDLKHQLEGFTKVHAKRQKLMGLPSKGKLLDSTVLSACGLKQRHKFIMMGTPEEELTLFALPPTDKPEIFDDFEMDYVPSMKDIKRNSDNRSKLKKIIESSTIHLIHAPRPGRKLLVLDLDYTILDCKNLSERENLDDYKRPHLDTFMASCYQHYDIAIWSQTHWRWVEVKLTEMGLLTHPEFRISFVLDRTMMFSVSSDHDKKKEHEVKALEIIWAKFPNWNKTNTIHVDDLSRNFAMNPKNGLKITPFKNALETKATDAVLLSLAKYLKHIADHNDLTTINHHHWEKYLQDNNVD